MKPLVGGIVGLIVAFGLGLWVVSAPARELPRRAAVPLIFLGLLWALSSAPSALLSMALLRVPHLVIIAIGAPLALGIAGFGIRSGASWVWTALLIGTGLSVLLMGIALPSARIHGLLSLLAFGGYMFGPALLGGSAAWIWRTSEAETLETRELG